jgi:hypothetical protein
MKSGTEKKETRGRGWTAENRQLIAKKEVRLLKISCGSTLPESEIRRLLQETLLLNETMQVRKNYYV